MISQPNKILLYYSHILSFCFDSIYIPTSRLGKWWINFGPFHASYYAQNKCILHYLWVVLAEVSQQLVNEPADQRPGSVDSSNKLRYNLEPIVNLDGADALM